MSKKIAEQDGVNDGQDGIASAVSRYPEDERSAYERGYHRGVKLKQSTENARKKLNRINWT